MLTSVVIIPRSTLISSLSVNHYLYTDDTQLLITFHQSNFSLA